jgi:hypothetical protein
MSDEEISSPSLKVYDGSSTTKSDYYICWSCMIKMRPTLLKNKTLPMFNNLSVDMKMVRSRFDEWEYRSEKEEGRNRSKRSILQPITKANSKLKEELQEWEVESTKGGANDGSG